MTTFRVGTDVGGTFTDLWVIADDGRQVVVKSPTTADIIGGILAAIDLAADELGWSSREFCESVAHFGHGTTAGLNALLTGNAARTALVTTRGFRDTLEIGRLKRQMAGLTELEIGDYLNRGRSAPVVPRSLVFEVDERVDRNGAVVTPLSNDSVRELVERIAAAEVDAIAVATLWSVANPEHELVLGEVLRERFPGAFVTLSHQVAPSVGEYARMSTTATNAALGPVMSGYLSRLSTVLAERGVTVPVLIMTSEGGVASGETVAEEPVAVLMSGPAAGVVACQQIGAEQGIHNLITVDVGGTSFDVGLVVGGIALVRPTQTLGGADIQRPSIDVATIGAGGGSIARVRGGVLSVGPESAGARPGPACYGLGGIEPTATDADLVLGVFAEDGFGDGAMRLSLDAARSAIHERVAAPLGIGVVRAAWGIRKILDSKMSDLLRSVTIEKGHDPRDFVVYAGGGQGPSHAWALCQELGISTFVVTASATVQSAFGTGTSDVKHSIESPHYLRLHAEVMNQDAVDALAASFEQMIESVRRDSDDESTHLQLSASVRYRGQAHHLDVDVAEVPRSVDDLGELLASFESDYESLFGAGSGFREAGFEVLGLRITSTRPIGSAINPRPADLIERVGSRSVYFDDPEKPVDCPLYATQFPAPGQELEGPCLVTYPGQTLVVPPGARARSDDAGSIIVTLGGE